MGDEIGEVGARRQMAREWRGGVERDDHRARPCSLLLMPAATLPMCVSGTARMTTSAPSSAASGDDAVDAEARSSAAPCPAGATSTCRTSKREPLRLLARR